MHDSQCSDLLVRNYCINFHCLYISRIKDFIILHYAIYNFRETKVKFLKLYFWLSMMY